MNKTVINFLLDLALLLVFVGLVFITTLLWFVFPTGTVADGWRLWGLSYDAWANIQFQLLSVITLGIAVHVMLHWSWVCGVIATRVFRIKAKSDDGTQTIAGVTFLMGILLLLAALLVAARLTIRSP